MCDPAPIASSFHEFINTPLTAAGPPNKRAHDLVTISREAKMQPLDVLCGATESKEFHRGFSAA